MPVYVHVVDHPDGRVLVDTGIKELRPLTTDLDPSHPADSAVESLLADVKN